MVARPSWLFAIRACVAFIFLPIGIVAKSDTNMTAMPARPDAPATTRSTVRPDTRAPIAMRQRGSMRPSCSKEGQPHASQSGSARSCSGGEL
eukprot:3572229-Prymnesium_polylepis.1